MAPLVLLSFDLTFGRDKAYETIKKLLDYADDETLSLDHLEKAAIQSGISKNAYNAFAQKFIDNDNFRDHTIAFLREQLQ